MVKHNAIYIGRENEKSLYVDFKLYRILFEETTKSLPVKQESLQHILKKYDAGLRTKKKRIKHKKLKEISFIMTALMNIA